MRNTLNISQALDSLSKSLKRNQVAEIDHVSDFDNLDQLEWLSIPKRSITTNVLALLDCFVDELSLIKVNFWFKIEGFST